MPLSFYTQRDSKIYPLFTESEISSEFTEQLSDSITTKDNSMLTSSITVHGHYSQLIRNQFFKKSEDKMVETKILHSLTLVNTTHSKRMKLQFFLISESGLTNISVNTMSFQMTCMFHWTKLLLRMEILTLSLKFHKFLKWTSTPTN